jgi:signal transduction histidine kinase/ActR/RegA family two-component response regulator
MIVLIFFNLTTLLLLLIFATFIFFFFYIKKLRSIYSEINIAKTEKYKILEKQYNDLLSQKVSIENEKKILEEELSKLKIDLSEAQEKAVQAERMKISILTNLSHEIRTPLTAIIGFANLLNDKELSSEHHKEFTGHIVQNGNLLLCMIEDLLDLSKIQSNSLEIEPVFCNLNVILVDLYLNYLSNKSDAGKSNVKLHLNNPLKSENFKIYTDPYRLRQIYDKLLSNAIKFTEEGNIEFGVKQNGDDIIFYVKDTGIGIDQEKIKDLFVEFNKIENNSTQLYRGAGIGLALAKQIANLLGGDLWVESTSNKGSTFYFTINWKANDLTDKRKIKYNWNGYTILVAEDEDDNYLLLEKILKKVNVNIIHARDGIEAIEFFEKYNHINMIFMDIRMPNMDGIGAIQTIKKINSTIPVIAITAYALNDEKEKILKHGFSDLITKPYKADAIYNILLNYFNNK